MFGPRGTGVLWGRRELWPTLRPSIPPFGRAVRDLVRPRRAEPAQLRGGRRGGAARDPRARVRGPVRRAMAGPRVGRTRGPIGRPLRSARCRSSSSASSPA
ncbi:hypothetical protein WMF44_04030 [Sorangium sp. So ce426]